MSSHAIARVIDLHVDGRPAHPSMAKVAKARDLLHKILREHRIEHVAREDLYVTHHYDLTHPGDTPSLFFGTLQRAFDGHFGIALRPEVLWYLVMDVVAEVVKRHPAAYGEWFSRDPSRKIAVEVRDDSLVPGASGNDWGCTIAKFDQVLRNVVPDGIMDVLLPDLSTATAETRAASLVAFMDAASPFYSYRVGSFCGIPRIRLDGTAQDWATIARHAGALRTAFAAHLDWYFDELCPVLDTIADQAGGAPLDEGFWRSIYRYESSSGRSNIDGWSTAFVGHVRERRADETFELVEKPASLRDWRTNRQGMAPGLVSTHVSTVDFIWNVWSTEYPMKFVGGVLGVDLEDETTLVPRLSYAVVHQLE